MPGLSHLTRRRAPPCSWDNLYTTELSNHAADPSDIGTIWFDDSDAEAKILAFVARLAGDKDEDEDDEEDEEGRDPIDTPQAPPVLSRSSTSFLDLGCGNGSLLFALRDDGWHGRALGVDYSAQSVALAQRVASSRRSEAEQHRHDTTVSTPPPPPEFREWDVLGGPLPTALDGAQSEAGGWDVVLDKGTFDAVSLSGEADERGRRRCEDYRARVLRLVRPRGGLFLVTSCNWTEAELRGWFEGRDEAGSFAVAGRVEYRSFSFGGVKGQTISTLCFRRMS